MTDYSFTTDVVKNQTTKNKAIKLENIGFYTLTDARAKTVSANSDLQRCELILTSRCNFKCPYCRGMKPLDKGDMSFEDAYNVVRLWSIGNLKNIRFSGGEPTLWPRLVNLVAASKNLGINRIALSTNGSADIDLYYKLADAGINDFSISLDGCCAATGYKMAGGLHVWDKVVENIKKISKVSYTTVGVVLTDDNQGELQQLIDFASSLGVSDIRIIPAAQVSKKLSGLNIKNAACKYPILKYRIDNFINGRNVRGLSQYDNNKCPLVLDDMAVLNGKHYPCIIYMREHGNEIGRICDDINVTRNERFQWFLNHNCFEDEICRNNCLDVCVEYNNKVMDTNNILSTFWK